jgi:hypothetical protein
MGQRQVGLSVGFGDRLPARQVCAARHERTAAPGEWISGRWLWLVEIGHAAVS